MTFLDAYCVVGTRLALTEEKEHDKNDTTFARVELTQRGERPVQLS